MSRDRKSSKSGFTLIEVIAVLVILAVLAAVAIPRYINLIQESRRQALQGALAAGTSHVSLAYGRMCLMNGKAPTEAELAAEVTANPLTSTDYTFTYTPVGGSGITVGATDVKDNTVTGTKLWATP